jgi:modulator of FtsH protease HflC
MNSNSIKYVILAVITVFLAVTVYQGFFVVRPDQFAIVTEFGEPVEIIAAEKCNDKGANCRKVPDPGLHFKLPFVQDVRYIDARVRGWNDTGLDTKTVTNREIDFTAFARWRVSDPLQYYIAHNKGAQKDTERAAHGSMDSIVTTRIQSAVRQQRLKNIVRMSDRTFAAEEGLNLQKLVANFEECHPERNLNIREALDAASLRVKTRKDLEEQSAEARNAADLDPNTPAKKRKRRFINTIKDDANLKLDEGFGISIYDLHFKYLNYSTKIHASMIQDIAKDRERDIETYRKIQNFCAGAINKNKLEAVGRKLAESERTVRKIRGKAMAKAIELKARAFNEDPEFYRFIRTLELYEKSMTRGTKLIVSSNSPLLALMKDESVMKPVPQVDSLKVLTPEELGETAHSFPAAVPTPKKTDVDAATPKKAVPADPAPPVKTEEAVPPAPAAEGQNEGESKAKKAGDSK